ncbi:MAG: hypothetical protein ACKO8I_13615 [Cyanobacteriota bacterium]
MKGAAVEIAEGSQHMSAAHLLKVGYPLRLNLQGNGDLFKHFYLGLIKPDSYTGISGLT